MKKHKGQTLSINTIVIAAIALVVLIVLIFIFVNRSNILVDTVENCIANNGECAVPKEKGGDGCAGIGAPHPTIECKDNSANPDATLCCIKVGGEEEPTS